MCLFIFCFDSKLVTFFTLPQSQNHFLNDSMGLWRPGELDFGNEKLPRTPHAIRSPLAFLEVIVAPENIELKLFLEFFFFLFAPSLVTNKPIDQEPRQMGQYCHELPFSF